MTIFTFFQLVRSHAQSDLRVQNATRVPYFSRKGLDIIYLACSMLFLKLLLFFVLVHKTKFTKVESEK